MTFFEVAVVAPIATTLTYKGPSSNIAIYPGQRLMVPLGPRLVTGYCLGFAQEPTQKIKLRRIHSTLDSRAIFPPNMVPFFRWVADYYKHPIGEIIKTALPSGLSPKSGRIIQITALGKISLNTPENLEEYSWLQPLLEKGQLSITQTKKLWSSKEKRTLEEWQQNAFVAIKSAITKDIVRQKTEICVRPSPGISMSSATTPSKKSEKKTLDLLCQLLSDQSTTWVAKKDITKLYAGASKAIKDLAKTGTIEITEREIYRDPFGERPPHYPTPAQLTTEQKEVLGKITPEIQNETFAPFLLHGITGSGKTEVYLRAAETALTLKKTVLVLVPEIALATQIEGHFLSRFGNIIALLHSGLTSSEKYDHWQRILKGDAQIVIGARSAVFAPLENIGVIIVDEEHDGAYKQDNGFRYNGRDMAVLRAKQHNAVVILGSATPSVNSYHHALNGKYSLLHMEHRVADQQLPKVEVIDLRAIKTTSGQPPIFSPQLTRGLRANLENGDQSLVFLNRRGYANLMICRDCGQSVDCQQCNVSLTPHHHHRELICHYCGFKQKKPEKCPHCQSANITDLGFGTERIEEELKKLFPKAAIARLDQDTTTKRGDFLRILKSVYQQKTDILVGTQMIAKGHHFPHVTLVGVVWADAGLGIPDYRASERTFQLLTQVFGRAGRGEKPGRVLVQTHNPEHYTISTSREHDYVGMYNKEIVLRQKLGYPPFSRLINFIFEGQNEAMVKKATLFISQTIKKLWPKHVAVLGPAPAPISKLRGLFRWQLLLKTSNIEISKQVCRIIQDTEIPGIAKSAAKLSVDVDPENML